MNIAKIIKLKYPDANLQKDVIIQDDGQGQYIKEWNLDTPKPTEKDLLNWETEVTDKIVFEENKIVNAEIYKQLDQIDLKSIRALRNNETDRLQALELEAVNLRAQLLPEK